MLYSPHTLNIASLSSMFVPSEQFQLLAHQFVALEQSLHESPSLEERAQLLRRMKIVIAQMDNLILPTLEEWMQNPTASPRQPTIGLD